MVGCRERFLHLCLEVPPRRLARPAHRLLGDSGIHKKDYSTNESLVALNKDSVFHLNPPPTDYSHNAFADKAVLTLSAGSGGHGCISFLREKYIENGPANGGDGGTGGSVYIQATREETSLHKLARRSLYKAGRGRNGQGKGKGGQRGEDLLIKVPVGTVLREISRHDPVEKENNSLAISSEAGEGDSALVKLRRDRWITYPSAKPSQDSSTAFPPLPETRRSQLASAQPEPPISIDLSRPMGTPMLLAAGAVGGFGNPHFVTRTNRRPKFATRGDCGMSLTVELELKLLADVGFVGMPNAGKSTLLRALSRSRARVGSWAFTTLQPNIGTVILDSGHGRPSIQASTADGEPRTQISIADIPGLIPDAHLDKGLGLGFLRHIERAQVLAFVIDLSNGDAIEALTRLWREIREYEKLKDDETSKQTEARLVQWEPLSFTSNSFTAPRDQVVAKSNESMIIKSQPLKKHSVPPMMRISSKPWFVIATKGDLEGTQENFVKLQAYLDMLSQGNVEHPSGRKHPWKGALAAIPVSAIRGEGVERIARWTVSLLNGEE